MQMKAGLTFACLNLKKLAKMKDKMGLFMNYYRNFLLFFENKCVMHKNNVVLNSDAFQNRVCLQSEGIEKSIPFLFPVGSGHLYSINSAYFI